MWNVCCYITTSLHRLPALQICAAILPPPYTDCPHCKLYCEMYGALFLFENQSLCPYLNFSQGHFSRMGFNFPHFFLLLFIAIKYRVNCINISINIINAVGKFATVSQFDVKRDEENMVYKIVCQDSAYMFFTLLMFLMFNV